MIIFSFLIKTICCDPSSEPSYQDGSYVGSQPIFLCRINKNYPNITKYSLLSRTWCFVAVFKREPYQMFNDRAGSRSTDLQETCFRYRW